MLDFRARTHGNSWQGEGRIVRENTRVVAGKILFRFPSCPAYRGKRARTEIFYSTRDSIDLSPSTFDYDSLYVCGTKYEVFSSAWMGFVSLK